MSREEGKALIMKRTKGGDEVEARVCKTSLRCPLTRLLPDRPVRGVNCQHLQCFDLRPFVILQEKAKSNRWTCPICGVKVLSVVLDLYLEEVVKKAREQASDTVEFTEDGKYVLIPDVEDLDEEETGVGKRKAGPLSESVPFKRSEIGGRLNWKDFALTAKPCNLYTSRCYEAAKTFTLVRAQFTSHSGVS